MKKPTVVLFALLFLVACRAAPVAPQPTVALTAIAATAAPTADQLSPTADQPQPTADRPPPTADALFPFAWDDRAPFAAGLIDPAEADIPGAPVYHIDLTIADDMASLSGRQTVYFTNREDVALNELYFHLHPNVLDSRIDVSEARVDGAPITPELSGPNDSLLRLPLAAPLPPGGLATVEMSFSGQVATDIGRNYGVLSYFDGILALAHFYPMLSVYDAPSAPDATGWNTAEPDIQGDLTYSDASFFIVRVTAPADVVLVGAGTEIDRVDDGDTQTVTFAGGPARDFYLAAGDFAVVSAEAGGTTINSYAPADLVDGAKLALEVAAAALKLQSARLGPYPYTELDIVTTPTSALGIEYPGLIVGTLRMYNPEATTQSGLPMGVILESTTAHEVSHQWFYNLVGNDQLDQPWLDEAVGSYATYRYYVDRYGQEAGDAYFENFIGRWQRVDEADIPIGLPVSAYEGDEYSAIVYGRGPIFLRELEEEMGRETFDAFLRDYVSRFRWGVAGTADFRALAEQHCGCDLGPLFEEWVTR